MVLRLALLLCDTPIPTVLEKYGDYSEIFKSYFKASLPNPGVDYRIDSYDVVTKQEYPPFDEDYHGIILTGSAASAYADLPWIKKLIDYIKTLANTNPRVKIIGICFGHQIIAMALGGTCVPNNGKWEVGTTEIALTDKGKEVFGVPSLQIHQMHRDHVPTLPPGFVLLGSTEVSKIQGMVLLCKEKPDEIHVFSVQGHPEFLPDIINKVIDLREKMGIMNADTVKDGRQRAVRRDDGIGIIGVAIWNVLGVKASSEQ